MVTTKLTSVVRIIYNSTRPPPSPANSVSVCHSSVQRPPSRLQFLIANLELEFRLRAIRINELKFSNRKFLAILRPSFWILSSFELQVASFQNLIENARLTLGLTLTRISPLEISNRERMAVSRVARGQTSLRAALLSFTDHNSLVTSHVANLSYYSPLLARH
jgi:hypothetical protein